MRLVFNRNNDYTLDKRVAVALGTFDGIHKGHQALINQLKLVQKKFGCLSMIHTFRQHPLTVLQPEKTPPLITSLAQKVKILNKWGVDILVLNEFDRSFSRIPPREFIEKFLLKNYNVCAIVVGYNFRFGYKGKGNVRLLREVGKQNGIEVIVVPPVRLAGQLVSSSLVRNLIEQGKVKRASYFLGYPYSISGRVVHGYGRGRKIGVPTANLSCDSRKVIPKHGVYLTLGVTDGKKLWGVTNVGKNPTFNLSSVSIETHFIDYKGDLYGKFLKVFFLRRIRDEVQYKTVNDLREQIYHDVEIAKKMRLQIHMNVV